MNYELHVYLAEYRLPLPGKEERNVEFEIKTHGPSGDSSPISLIVNACASRDVGDSVVGVCFIAQDITGQKNIMDKFTRIEGDYRAIIQNPHPLIPPIFGTDQFGWCSEWNSAMTKLTGWRRDDVIDKMLLGEVFGTQAACCRLKNQEAFVNFGVVLNNAMTGQECAKISFGFFARNGKYVECLLCVSKRLDREGAVTGLFCFLQLASHELQQALHIQRLSEQTALKRLKVLAYIRRQIRNPLSGIIFSRKMLEGTNLGEEQKNILRTSSQCQRQLNKILDDTDLDSIIDGYVIIILLYYMYFSFYVYGFKGFRICCIVISVYTINKFVLFYSLTSYLDLEMLEFKLHEVLVASISQIMMKSNGKNIMIVNDMVEDLLNETLYGDSPRLQQVLANFLLVSVNSTPSGGQLSISGRLTKDRIGESVQLALLEFR